MNKNLYIKFLNNRCTTEELKEVAEWVHSGAFREESRKWGLENWKSFEDYTNIQDDEKFSELFDKIRDHINTERKVVKIKRVMINWMMRAAAILFIPSLSVLLITNSQKNSVTSQYNRLAVQYQEMGNSPLLANFLRPLYSPSSFWAVHPESFQFVVIPLQE